MEGDIDLRLLRKILVQESVGHLLEELVWREELAYNAEILVNKDSCGREFYKDI